MKKMIVQRKVDMNVNRISDLNEVLKVILVLSLVLVVYAVYLVWGHYVLAFESISKYINSDELKWAIELMYFASSVNVFLVVIGFFIHHNYIAGEKVYVVFSLLFVLLVFVLLSFQMGVLNIVTGAGLMGNAIVGLFLFKLRLVLFLFFFSLVALFGLGVASSYEIVSYSPILNESPFDESSPSLFWILSMTFFSLPFILISVVVGAFSISQWRRYEAEIVELASVDFLTRVNNRRSLMESFDKELKKASRLGRNGYVSCIIVDLDNFKLINDKYGHLTGDDILVGAASILVNCVRDYDIVGRYGGEEFMIILPGTDLDGAVQTAERCREDMESYTFDVDGQGLVVTASFGVACNTQTKSGSMQELVSLSDQALYEAKSSGRNKVICFKDVLAEISFPPDMAY